MILGQEIMQLMAVPRVPQRDHAKTRKFAILHQAFPAHDEGVNERLGHAGQFRERTP